MFIANSKNSLKKNNNENNLTYFHCYATANDNMLYLRDIQNLMRIRNYTSGVGQVFLFIAISKVKKINFFDKLFVRAVKKIFLNNDSIILKDIFFKENLGRDFSSYDTLSKRVKEIALPEDFVFFQNRSAFGPYLNDWYLSFISQFEKFESTALCGSTINFKDHPTRSFQYNTPHVQTYSFLTKVFFLNLLGNSFPGSRESERLQIILKGEIGLSSFFLSNNYKITCMEWPDNAISALSNPIAFIDIKTEVTQDHQFYHRKYFKKKKRSKIRKVVWKSYFNYFLLYLGISNKKLKNVSKKQ